MCLTNVAAGSKKDHTHPPGVGNLTKGESALHSKNKRMSGHMYNCFAFLRQIR